MIPTFVAAGIESGRETIADWLAAAEAGSTFARSADGGTEGGRCSTEPAPGGRERFIEIRQRNASTRMQPRRRAGFFTAGFVTTNTAIRHLIMVSSVSIHPTQWRTPARPRTRLVSFRFVEQNGFIV
jgi:hypothetical protein